MEAKFMWGKAGKVCQLMNVSKYVTRMYDFMYDFLRSGYSQFSHKV